MATSKFRQGLARIKERGGLGSVIGQTLFPIPSEVAADMDPETIRQIRNQAMVQMGLGMLAAKDRGARFSTGAQYGLGQGQDALRGGLGSVLVSRRAKREDERLDLAERRQQEFINRGAQLDEQRAKERAEDVAYRNQQATAAAAERVEAAKRAATDDARQAQMLALSKQGVTDKQTQQVIADRLTGALGKLRGANVPETDPLVIRLITELKGMGIDVALPRSSINPFGSGQAPPDLSGLLE